MMTKKSKTPLTPKLRFPEFRDKGEWEELPLHACFSHIRNGFVGTATPFYVDGGVPYLQGKNVKKGRIDPTGLITVSKVFHEKQKKSQLQRDDIVMVQSGHVGECAHIDDAYMGANCHALIIMTPRERQHSPCFVHCFGSDYGAALIAQITTGNTIKHILASGMKALIVRTPPLIEQQRIADCLSTLDDLISAEGRKLAALRAHKQGLMQQLFPQPGQSQPRLRFPEFRNAPEWTVKKAGALFSQRKAKGEPGLPLYSVTIADGMVLRSSFDRNFYDIKKAASNKNVRKGDIAYNMMRMWQGACGVAPEDCLVSPAYVVLKPKQGVYPDFFFSLFKLHGSLHLLTVYSHGLTLDRLRLYFDDFAAMPLVVPQYEEQQRIAACLTTLDTRIAAQAAKIDALKIHKRGLMQQLFPAPEKEMA